jgi:hypothetical protein
MSETKLNFDNQNLLLKNEKCEVELFYESWHSNSKTIAQELCKNTIEFSQNYTYSNTLKIVYKSQNIKKECLLKGIDGGSYLHISTEEENGSTVKLFNNILYLSIGYNFFAFDLIEQNIKWQIHSENGEYFEFYNLEQDFLIRGELEIERINKNGERLWNYGGRDIWVNIEEGNEVKINEKEIELKDFEGSKYYIDFNGKTLRTEFI